MGTLQQQDDRTKRGLEVPSLLLNNNISTDLSPRSYGTQSVGSSQDPLVIPSSDFTVPTSNVSPYTPETLHGSFLDDSNHNGRRGVFGNRVQTKYNVVTNPKTTTTTTTKTTTTTTNNNHNVVTPKGTKYPVSLFSKQESQMSDLSPGPVTPKSRKRDILSPPPPHGFSSPRRSSSAGGAGGGTTNSSGQGTLYMQSFLLGIAFMAIWSPQNIMAPNLTAMAKDFGFTPSQRDLYLGANIALATGVLSLPISAGIGILADIWNRKYLFVGTVACGGLASLATGLCRSYAWLFLARFINGGCMSGSVPIAFSLLGDLFDTNERNAASSGLTAMMGLGIIMGQVYAGMVGPSLGWWEPFYASSVLTLTSALLVLLFVQEPIRGGKEQVLQDMLRQGTKYDRKLTWGGFIHAIRHNRSNVILMWQGFFSSIPWGIIFVFLNDYLSVNRGFSVQDATLLVAVFGIGCACGGMLGGYWGQILQSRNRSYLPLFMSLTTFVGIFPFLLLLDSSFSHAGFLAITYSFLGGCIESLPSVNVRPCLINVNPPETRGAALTAANLIINLARGIGPSFITLMAAIWGADRQVSFNVTVSTTHVCVCVCVCVVVVVVVVLTCVPF